MKFDQGFIHYKFSWFRNITIKQNRKILYYNQVCQEVDEIIQLMSRISLQKWS